MVVVIGGESDGLSSGKSEVGGGVVQLLDPVRRDRTGHLIRKAIASPRPVESKRGEHRCHRVIGVTRDAARRIKREQDLRSKFPDAQR